MKVSRWLILGLTFLLPAYYWRFSLAGLPTNFWEVALGITVLVFLFEAALGKSRLQLPLAWPIGLILLGLILSLPLALDRSVALGIIKGWFVVPLVYYWMLVNSLTEADRWRLYQILSLNLFLIGLGALAGWLGLINWNVFGHDILQYQHGHRATAFFESPNSLAMYLGPLLVLTLGALASRRQWPWLLLLLPAALALGLTFSRAGYLAVFGALAFLFFPRLAKKWRVAAILGLAALLIAGLAFSLFERSGSDQTRTLVWSSTLRLLVHQPLLGIGPGQFQAHLDRLLAGNQLYAQFRSYLFHPHNLYLNFWLSSGLIGLTGFLSVVYLTLGRLWHQTALEARAITAALLTILVHGLFDSTYFKNDLAVIFWLVIGLGWLLGRSKTDATNLP